MWTFGNKIKQNNASIPSISIYTDTLFEVYFSCDVLKSVWKSSVLDVLCVHVCACHRLMPDIFLNGFPPVFRDRDFHWIWSSLLKWTGWAESSGDLPVSVPILLGVLHFVRNEDFWKSLLCICNPFSCNWLPTWNPLISSLFLSLLV